MGFLYISRSIFERGMLHKRICVNYLVVKLGCLQFPVIGFGSKHGVFLLPNFCIGVFRHQKTGVFVAEGGRSWRIPVFGHALNGDRGCLRSAAKKGAYPVALRLTPPFYGPSVRNGRQTHGAIPVRDGKSE